MSRPYVYLGNHDLLAQGRAAFSAGDLQALSLITEEAGQRRSALASRVRTTLEELRRRLEQASPKSELLFGKYEVVAQLPTGMGGEAYEIRDGAGVRYFAKRARTISAIQSNTFRREIEIYRCLQRSNASSVLRVVEVFEDAKAGYMGFVTEFAEGGTLQERVLESADGSLPHAEAKQVAIELANGLMAIHAAGVVHRDVKPANIVRTDAGWKFVDFGISKELAKGVQSKTFQMHGTVGYSPPEQWDGVEASAEADVYALGKVIAFILRGETDPDLLVGTSWWGVVSGCTARERAARLRLPVVAELLARV